MRLEPNRRRRGQVEKDVRETLGQGEEGVREKEGDFYLLPSTVRWYERDARVVDF